MKKLIITLFLILPFLGFTQDNNSIIMNNKLVKEYFEDYVSEALERGYDVQDKLVSKIDYILVAPKNLDIPDLAETDLEIKLIALDYNVTIDRLVLKINLYRELSYVLGVPYNTASVMMDRDKVEGFSYAAFNDANIMYIELSKVLSYIE